ncbi:MAG: helix-turn-helix transcriptional regulator [Phycisphaeraceae bacterium]|nr:helix-turn-helix transcriptional regulator [Phycisphaeraceae bacterium]
MMQENSGHPVNPAQAAACCRPIDRLLCPELFRAIGDPTRASLLACLAKCGRPCTVTEIAACCSVDLSVVSRHLALMERGGLLASSKQGRTVSYAVRYVELAGLLRALADELEQCCERTPGSADCASNGCAPGCA